MGTSIARKVEETSQELAKEEDVFVIRTVAYRDSRNYAKVQGETEIDRLTAEDRQVSRRLAPPGAV